MFDLIERLRQKPDGAKKRIAFLTSLSLTGFIFAIWLSVIYPDFSFKERQKQTASANKAGMFSSFVANITEGFGGVKTQINNIKDAVSSLSTTTHYTVDTEASSTVVTGQSTTTTEVSDPNL